MRPCHNTLPSGPKNSLPRTHFPESIQESSTIKFLEFSTHLCTEKHFKRFLTCLEILDSNSMTFPDFHDLDKLWTLKYTYNVVRVLTLKAQLYLSSESVFSKLGQGFLNSMQLNGGQKKVLTEKQAGDGPTSTISTESMLVNLDEGFWYAGEWEGRGKGADRKTGWRQSRWKCLFCFLVV